MVVEYDWGSSNARAVSSPSTIRTWKKIVYDRKIYLANPIVYDWDRKRNVFDLWSLFSRTQINPKHSWFYSIKVKPFRQWAQMYPFVYMRPRFPEKTYVCRRTFYIEILFEILNVYFFWPFVRNNYWKTSTIHWEKKKSIFIILILFQQKRIRKIVILLCCFFLVLRVNASLGLNRFDLYWTIYI